MRRKDREQLQRARFTDAIVNEAMEMVASGDMTPQQEKEWYTFFAKAYGFNDLIPKLSVKVFNRRKSNIRARMEHWYTESWFKSKPVIPGGPPVVTVDATYKPLAPAEEPNGLAASRYLNQSIK